jgi:hypothetical protein
MSILRGKICDRKGAIKGPRNKVLYEVILQSVRCSSLYETGKNR